MVRANRLVGPLMAILDFRQLATAPTRCDVVIVGTGPAGITVARQLAQSNLTVVLLETGGEAHDGAAEACSQFESVGDRRAPALAVRRRIFGGTSLVWTGRCVPLSPIDFQARRWVPGSGWPIDESDLAPYWGAAGRLLGIGPHAEGDRLWSVLDKSPDRPTWDRRLFAAEVYQCSVRRDARGRIVPPAEQGDADQLGALSHGKVPTAVDFAEAARELFASSAHLHVWQHAHVREVLSDANGRRAIGVAIARADGPPHRLTADHVVLACGGIDNARLLLQSGPPDAGGLGNAHDQVGRHLSDHHYCALGHFEGDGPSRLRKLLSYHWQRASRDHLYLNALSLAPGLQRERELLRAAVFPFEHHRGPSAIGAAAAAVRAARRGAVGEALRQMVAAAGNPYRLGNDGWDRMVRRRVPRAPLHKLEIGCNVEQLADPDSRVSLSATRDAFGLPRARIDWRIHEAEWATYRAAAELFADECRRLGMPGFRRNPILDLPFEQWREHVHDMAHPMCSTRMADDPRRGVVDADGAVFGVEGLSIAGSSVFATGGTANPTMTLVALAVRLGRHLRRRLTGVRGSVAQAPAVSATPNGEPRLKLGIVGAGDRVRRVYAPVLAALANRVEIVGICGGSAERTAATAAMLGCPTAADPNALRTGFGAQALLVAVPDRLNAEMIESLLPLELPILVETPPAWTEARLHRLCTAVRRRRARVTIAEQFPWDPVEQLRAKLVQRGVIGLPTEVVNHFDAYDYHGIARSRAMLGRDRLPRLATGRHANAGEVGALPAHLHGGIEFADGAALRHHFAFGTVAADPADRWYRIVGSLGHIHGDEVVVAARDGEQAERARIEVERDAAGTLRRAHVRLREYGTIAWTNPFGPHALDDEQLAVANLASRWIDAVADDDASPYSLQTAADDVAFLRAMRHAAMRGGAAVRLPLHPVASALRTKAAAALRKVGGGRRRA